jgi:hypothetical protein
LSFGRNGLGLLAQSGLVEAFRFSIGSALEFATAAAKQTVRGEDQIVVYVFPRQSSVPTNIQRRQAYWQQDLSEHMVPAVFVRTQPVIMLSNGRIDRSLLPAPSDDNLLERPVSKEYSKPTEKKLLDVIRELLNQPAVTAEDSFFLAGGHSLPMGDATRDASANHFRGGRDA